MKTLFAVFSAVALVSLSVARANVIYFDDFEQFPNGTTLTETNYIPATGISSEIGTNDNGASTTVVASNLLGSVRAFFKLGALPYQHKYRGDPLGDGLTNQVVTLAFKLWVAQTKSASSIGGIGINLATTDTNIDHNPLILINDGGQVIMFTNSPSPPGALNDVQIGSWSALAGTIMTNVLTLDYPDGTFSFSLNGTTLTNGPIPQFITNIFDRVRFDLFEGLTGAGTLNSQGNRFALDDVRLSSGAASTNRDVRNYIAAAKGKEFEQLSPAAPSLAATGFLFHADVRGFESNSIVAASVHLPGGATKSLLPNGPGSSQREFNDAFTSKSALDAAYQSGTYTMSIDAQNQGALSAALNLPADNYPSTPHIANFTAAQSIHSATNFTVVWDAFTGGTSTDFINIEIEDTMGSTLIGSPDIGETNALNGTATSFTIPGGALLPSTTYNGRVLFVKRTTTDANSVPGALGLAGYFAMTEFSLATAASSGELCTLAPNVSTNDTSTTASLTAHLSSNGNPLAGHSVNFNITAGPNAGTNATSVTDVSGNASFSYSSVSTGTDTVQAFDASSASSTGTASVVWLPPNVPPVARCHAEVTVNATSNCSATVLATTVDDASSDSDGTIVNRTLTPPGAASGVYDLGTNNVTLTVTDDRGGTDSCSAVIIVVDQTRPTIACPPDKTVSVPFGATNAVVTFAAPTVSDNCSVASTNISPASGSTFPLGTNQVTCTATDESGNSTNCTFHVIVTQAPPSADLAISKIASPNPVIYGSNITYAITVTNLGPNDATSVVVTDALPLGVTFVSATPSQGTCTQIAGVVSCDLGALSTDTNAVISLVVAVNTRGAITNTAAVGSDVADPASSNNRATAVTTVSVHDFAVVALKVPRTVTLTATRTNQTKLVRVKIQNRSPQSETVSNLADFVTLALTSLNMDSPCQPPVPTLHVGLPQHKLPVTLKPKQKLTVVFDVTFTCAVDPMKTSAANGEHNDFSYAATVQAGAIDGEADADPFDDNCPHAALPYPGNLDPFPNGKIKDAGCGGKISPGIFGAAVTTDVVAPQ